MKAVFLLILLASPIFPEAPGAAIARRRAEYPDLAEIVDLAQSTPPEFSARALLRIAASPRLHDKVWKREILEQAFQSASAARDPIRKQIMDGPSTAGSRAALISQAAAIGLDRLTLQTHAATAMLAIDPKRARELLLSIPQPKPSRMRCEDALLDDPSPYFAAAARIMPSGESVRFLNERIQNITSAVEIAPAASVIPQSKLLLSSFATALLRIDSDDRAFASSLPAIARAMASLPASGALADAYRQFLVRNLTGARCAESGEQWQQNAIASAISSFNNSMTSEAIAPIKMEDLKPAKVEGKANLDPAIPADDEQHLRAKLGELIFGNGPSGLKDEEKNTEEWRDRFAALLREIDGMKSASGESEALFFFRKGSALSAALLAAPPGSTRDTVMQQYIAFLKASNFQQESLTEWFGQVTALAESMNGASHQKLLDALENSGHAVLSTYARIERLLPAAPTWAQAGQ